MYEKEMKTGDLRFVPYKVINTSEVAGVARLVEYITVGGFVQEVLGLEIAMRFMVEDLGVDARRAREVLVESAEVGELVGLAGGGCGRRRFCRC